MGIKNNFPYLGKSPNFSLLFVENML